MTTMTVSPPLYKRLIFWRRATQAFVALFFIALPFVNQYGLNFFYGNLLSFKAGTLPLADPLAVAQVGILAGSFTNDMLLGAGLVLALALLLGSVFCSWICPFGLLSELLYKHSVNKWGATLSGRFGESGESRRQSSRKQSSRWGYGFFFKLAVMLTGLLLCLLVLTVPFLNQFSMPGWFTRLWQAAALEEYDTIFSALALLGFILLLELIWQKRLWCRYLCPQSVMISLARLFTPRSLGIAFAPAKCVCKGKKPCSQACSLNLEPRSNRLGQKLACTNCGQCVESCAQHGKALSFSFKSLKSAKRFTNPTS